MVAKLIKQELKALLRILVFLGIACLSLGVVGRLLVAADRYGFIGILLNVVAIYVSFAMIFAAFILSVVRFSRSLYTGEGYLTFSLPVTTDQLLISKILSALISMFVGAGFSVLTTVIVLTGVSSELWFFGASSFGEIFFGFLEGIVENSILVAEGVILMIVGMPLLLLACYAVSSIGQLFSKARGFITFGIGFVVFVIVVPILNTYCLIPILRLASMASEHLSIWILIFLEAGVDVGCYFLVRYIITHKLNLLG